MSLPKISVAAAVTAVALAAVVSGIAAAAAGVEPADQRLAARAQARLTDLPAGWRAVKSPSGGGTSRCIGTPKGTTGKSQRAFARSSTASAAGLVAVFRTAAQAQTAFATITSERTWNCFTAEIEDANVASDLRQRRFALRGIGVPAVGREIAAVYEQQGMRMTAVIHLDAARKGRSVVLLYHVGALGPALRLGEESTVLRRMAARLS